MGYTQEVVCIQKVLVEDVSVTCLNLATECLTKNVASNVQLVCSCPCIISMQFFIILLTLGVGAL